MFKESDYTRILTCRDKEMLSTARDMYFTTRCCDNKNIYLWSMCLACRLVAWTTNGMNLISASGIAIEKDDSNHVSDSQIASMIRMYLAKVGEFSNVIEDTKINQGYIEAVHDLLKGMTMADSDIVSELCIEAVNVSALVSGYSELTTEQSLLLSGWSGTVLSGILGKFANNGLPPEVTSNVFYKNKVTNMHNFDEAMVKNLNAYFGWYCSTGIEENITPILKRRLATVSLAYGMTDYNSTFMEETYTDINEELEQVRNFKERSALWYASIRVRARADKRFNEGWMLSSDLLHKFIQWIKPSVVLCNIGEWGPLTSIGFLDHNKCVERFLFLIFGKMWADASESDIELDETGNTAGLVRNHIDEFVEIRNSIIYKTKGISKIIQTNLELYGALGERHLLAARREHPGWECRTVLQNTSIQIYPHEIQNCKSAFHVYSVCLDVGTSRLDWITILTDSIRDHIENCDDIQCGTRVNAMVHVELSNRCYIGLSI